MKLPSKLLLTLLITGLFASTAFSQWAKGKSKGYYKLSAWYLSTDQHFTDTGETDPNVTRNLFNLNLYGEYGLTDKIDLIAYIPFFSRVTQNDQVSGTVGTIIQEGEAFNSIGDIDIGVSYAFLKNDNLALSATLKLGLPTGDDSGGSDGSFQTGDGEFNQMILVNLGVPFQIKNIPFYSKIYAGFNNKTQNFSDEFRTGFEVGANVVKDKLWLVLRSDIIESFQNGSLNAQNSNGSIFANNIEFFGIGGEASYYITKKLGVSVNVTGAFSGRIIYANPTFSGGVFLDIK